jgi:hypothetical protein
MHDANANYNNPPVSNDNDTVVLPTQILINLNSSSYNTEFCNIALAYDDISNAYSLHQLVVTAHKFSHHD